MTQELPRISLVTPVFNGARYLEPTLRSVLDQGYPDLEYAVLDGGSTDGTLEIVRGFEDRLSWWTSEPDDGMYHALRKGLARVDGEIMGWINADDLHLPWTLSVVGEVFATFPEVEWITSLYPLAWDGRGRAVRCSKRERFDRRDFLGGGYLPAPERPGAFWIQQESTFWRRSLWERAGGRLDTALGLAADFELWGRFFAEAELVALETPLAGFRRHGDQLSLGDPQGYAREAEAVLERLGGRPRGVVSTRLRGLIRALWPNRLRDAGVAAGLLPAGRVCSWDWKAGGWRLR